LKLPDTFRTKKEVSAEELEEMVKKTLVDKFLVETIGKEIGERLENKELSRRLQIEFKKKLNIIEDNLKHKESDFSEYKNKSHIWPDKDDLHQKELKNILDGILKLCPEVKEEEIIHTYNNTFNIITEDYAYKFWFMVDTNNSKITKELIDHPDQKKCKKGKEAYKIYHNPIIQGDVKYAKFNKEHNEKIVKVLKDNNYYVTINIIKPNSK